MIQYGTCSLYMWNEWQTCSINSTVPKYMNMKNYRIIERKSIFQYFPGEYWTGREIPGNTGKYRPVNTTPVFPGQPCMWDILTMHPVMVDQPDPMLAEEHHVGGDARHIWLQRRTPRYSRHCPLPQTGGLYWQTRVVSQTNMVFTVLGSSFPMWTPWHRAPPQLS